MEHLRNTVRGGSGVMYGLSGMHITYYVCTKHIGYARILSTYCSDKEVHRICAAIGEGEFGCKYAKESEEFSL